MFRWFTCCRVAGPSPPQGGMNIAQVQLKMLPTIEGLILKKVDAAIGRHGQTSIPLKSLQHMLSNEEQQYCEKKGGNPRDYFRVTHKKFYDVSFLEQTQQVHVRVRSPQEVAKIQAEEEAIEKQNMAERDRQASKEADRKAERDRRERERAETERRRREWEDEEMEEQRLKGSSPDDVLVDGGMVAPPPPPTQKEGMLKEMIKLGGKGAPPPPPEVKKKKKKTKGKPDPNNTENPEQPHQWNGTTLEEQCAEPAYVDPETENSEKPKTRVRLSYFPPPDQVLNAARVVPTFFVPIESLFDTISVPAVRAGKLAKVPPLRNSKELLQIIQQHAEYFEVVNFGINDLQLRQQAEAEAVENSSTTLAAAAEAVSGESQLATSLATATAGETSVGGHNTPSTTSSLVPSTTKRKPKRIQEGAQAIYVRIHPAKREEIEDSQKNRLYLEGWTMPDRLFETLKVAHYDALRVARFLLCHLLTPLSEVAEQTVGVVTERHLTHIICSYPHMFNYQVGGAESQGGVKFKMNPEFWWKKPKVAKELENCSAEQIEEKFHRLNRMRYSLTYGQTLRMKGVLKQASQAKIFPEGQVFQDLRVIALALHDLLPDDSPIDLKDLRDRLPDDATGLLRVHYTHKRLMDYPELFSVWEADVDQWLVQRPHLVKPEVRTYQDYSEEEVVLTIAQCMPQSKTWDPTVPYEHPRYARFLTKTVQRRIKDLGGWEELLRRHPRYFKIDFVNDQKICFFTVNTNLQPTRPGD